MDPTIESQIFEHLHKRLYEEKKKISIDEIVDKFQQKTELVNNVLEKFVKKETERKAEICVSYILMGYKNDEGDIKLLRFVNCDDEELEERKKFFNEVVGTQIRIISPTNDDPVELPASNVPFPLDLDAVMAEQKLTGITNKFIKLRLNRLKKLSATVLKTVEKPEVKKEISSPVKQSVEKLESDSISKKRCENRLFIKENGSHVKDSKESSIKEEKGLPEKDSKELSIKEEKSSPEKDSKECKQEISSSDEERPIPLKKQEKESFTKITKQRKRIRVQFDDSDDEEIIDTKKSEKIEQKALQENLEKPVSDEEMKSVKKKKRESNEMEETNPPKKTKSESKSSKTKKPTNPPKKTRLITDMFFRTQKPLVK